MAAPTRIPCQALPNVAGGLCGRGRRRMQTNGSMKPSWLQMAEFRATLSRINIRIFVVKERTAFCAAKCCALGLGVIIGVISNNLLLIRGKFRSVRRPPTLLLPLAHRRCSALARKHCMRIRVSLGFPMLRSLSDTETEKPPNHVKCKNVRASISRSRD